MSRPSRSCFLSDAQPDREIDDLEKDEAHHEAVDHGRADAPQLGDHGAICTADFLLANTPVSKAPTMPPMPCTPNASNESS